MLKLSNSIIRSYPETGWEHFYCLMTVEEWEQLPSRDGASNSPLLQRVRRVLVSIIGRLIAAADDGSRSIPPLINCNSVSGFLLLASVPRHGWIFFRKTKLILCIFHTLYLQRPSNNLFSPPEKQTQTEQLLFIFLYLRPLICNNVVACSLLVSASVSAVSAIRDQHEI